MGTLNCYRENSRIMFRKGNVAKHHLMIAFMADQPFRNLLPGLIMSLGKYALAFGVRTPRGPVRTFIFVRILRFWILGCLHKDSPLFFGPENGSEFVVFCARRSQ